MGDENSMGREARGLAMDGLGSRNIFGPIDDIVLIEIMVFAWVTKFTRNVLGDFASQRFNWLRESQRPVGGRLGIFAP